MFNGLYPELNWYWYLIITLSLTHITIVSVTLYLHRCQAHHAIELHPAVAFFFRFWLWLTTGMNTREWVALHRKHHAKVETEQDPHSPQIYGINKVLWDGVDLYRKGIRDQKTIEEYGHGAPDDWFEQHLFYSSWTGIITMFFVDYLLFGVIGISIWAIQMLWIPLLAAGVINGLGHYLGYRNYDSGDASTNIFPLGILIGGEEMHNNHHAFASSAKFSRKWWEFDIGWAYICLLKSFGLARVNKVAQAPAFDTNKENIDVDTVQAVINHRLHIMSEYAHRVITRVYQEEHQRALPAHRPLLQRARHMLTLPQFSIDDLHQKHLEELLQNNEALNRVYDFKQRLQLIWQQKTASYDKLLSDLQDWCGQAEQSGISALEEFALRLRAYSMPAD